MKIGIDIDSTLNTLDDEWSAWIVKNLDPNFTLDKWTDWNLNKLTPAGVKVYEYLNLPGVFRNSGVRPGAVNACEMLAQRGHELFAVSSCDPAASWGEKHEWIGKHFPMIPNKNRIACSRKGLLKLDVLVDDGPHNFEGFDGMPILFHQPWNAQYSGIRANHWPAVFRLIENF